MANIEALLNIRDTVAQIENSHSGFRIAALALNTAQMIDQEANPREIWATLRALKTEVDKQVFMQGHRRKTGTILKAYFTALGWESGVSVNQKETEALKVIRSLEQVALNGILTASTRSARRHSVYGNRMSMALESATTRLEAILPKADSPSI